MTPAKLLLAIGAGLGSLVLFNSGALFVTKNVLLDMPAMEADAQYFRIGAEAMKKYPRLSPLDARSRYSNDLLVEMLAETDDKRVRALRAAEVFIGFWMTQGRARAEFCAESGVDLSRYKAAFEKLNRSGHEKATALLAEQGRREERLYEIHRGAMMSQIQYEMLYLKNGLPTERKAACQLLLDKQVELMPFLEFRRAIPAGNRELMLYGREG